MLRKLFSSIKRKTAIHDICQYLFITQKIFIILNIFLPFVKINNKKIVFCSYYGGNYSCNPKYITEELLKQNIDCKIVWLVDREKTKKIDDFPDTVKIVDYVSIRAFFELASAKIWIDNCRKSLYPYKRKGQVYFQTWHGGIALKKIEKDAENRLSLYYVKKAKRDSLMIDYCISSSKSLTKLYTESFWYSGEILEYGSPRNDLLVNCNNNCGDIVKQNLSLSSDHKIVLYAPTFRQNQSFDAYRINYTEIISALQHKFGNKWCFMTRLHPNHVMKADLLRIPEWVLNVTSYPDVQELLLITNVLISDYSSVMFDFMLTRRPVFIYAADYESYKNDRDTYFPINETPFLIAENNKQLIKNIDSLDCVKYNERIDAFIKHIGCFEHGKACQLVVDKIEDLMKNKDDE